MVAATKANAKVADSLFKQAIKGKRHGADWVDKMPDGLAGAAGGSRTQRTR
jgi:hypothetical protein